MPSLILKQKQMVITDKFLLYTLVLEKTVNVNGFNSWSLEIQFSSILSKKCGLCVYFAAAIPLNFLRNSMVDFKWRNEITQSLHNMSIAIENHFCEVKCCSSGKSQ